MKFSTSTSASLASRRTSDRPSASRRLTDTLFLFRQYVFQCVWTELSPPSSQRVAVRQRLDLDDLSAEVPELEG